MGQNVDPQILAKILNINSLKENKLNNMEFL